MRLTRLYPRTTVKPAVRTIIVPRPTAGSNAIGAAPLKDEQLLTWVNELLTVIAGQPVGSVAAGDTNVDRPSGA
jgi:hypothetical protein